MQRFVTIALVVAFAGLASAVQADDKANLTGTWKWSFTAADGQTRETTLKLKMDGDEVTGAIVGRDGKETKIEDAKFKDGEISFKVTRERNGEKVTMTYEGKVNKDTIKGKVKTDQNATGRPWEAKRAKEAAKTN